MADDRDVERKLETTLSERGQRYGNYGHMSALSCLLQKALRSALDTNRRDLVLPQQSHAMDMICVKLARLANGDVRDPDGWRDIAGYAILAMESCE